jgi:hypothetical protein
MPAYNGLNGDTHSGADFNPFERAGRIGLQALGRQAANKPQRIAPIRQASQIRNTVTDPVGPGAVEQGAARPLMLAN